MTQAVAAATLLAAGLATRYDPDVMQAVVANRIEWGQLEPSPDSVGFVALLDCDHIGKTVWLETPDGLLFRVQVADCAANQDRARLVQLGFAVDLSWELAQSLNVVDAPRAGFQIWDQLPQRKQALL